MADAEILESAREAAIEFLDNYDIQDFKGLALEMNKKDILIVNSYDIIYLMKG